MQTRVKEMRERAGLTQKQLADILGISQQSVYYYESGDRDIKASVLIDMSRALKCTVADLLGMSTHGMVASVPSKSHAVPIFGRIAAGTPREALSQSAETKDTDESTYLAHPHGFWLVVSGNSMNKVLPDGALVLIDPDIEVRNGDVCAVLIDGEDATIKRVYFEGNTVTFCPESYDPEYMERSVDTSDVRSPSIRFVGKAVAYCSPDGWRA